MGFKAWRNLSVLACASVALIGCNSGPQKASAPPAGSVQAGQTPNGWATNNAPNNAYPIATGQPKPATPGSLSTNYPPNGPGSVAPCTPPGATSTPPYTPTGAANNMPPPYAPNVSPAQTTPGAMPPNYGNYPPLAPARPSTQITPGAPAVVPGISGGQPSGFGIDNRSTLPPNGNGPIMPSDNGGLNTPPSFAR